MGVAHIKHVNGFLQWMDLSNFPVCGNFSLSVTKVLTTTQRNKYHILTFYGPNFHRVPVIWFLLSYVSTAFPLETLPFLEGVQAGDDTCFVGA